MNDDNWAPLCPIARGATHGRTASRADDPRSEYGMASQIVLDTPLIWIDKRQTWQLAQHLGGDTLVEMIRAETHSCYLGERAVLHDWGYDCDACRLRESGWRRWRHDRPVLKATGVGNADPDRLAA
jgi:7-cyano-7-deazaguanine synthase in queuosine biosynthesis